jgi:hypothetical protein
MPYAEKLIILISAHNAACALKAHIVNPRNIAVDDPRRPYSTGTIENG